MSTSLKSLSIILTWLALASASLCTAEAQEPEQPSYDPNATAESLGLEPWKAPEGLFPLFPWDHLASWGAQYQPLDQGIASMAECDFTMSAFVGTPETAEIARKNNLYCIYDVGIERIDQRKLSEEELNAALDRVEETVLKAIEETRDMPNVLGFGLMDEPGAYNFKGLARAVDTIKKHAPGKLAYINLYPGYASTVGADADSQLGAYSFEEYLERYVQDVKPQFISYDNYMIEYSEDTRDWNQAIVFFTDLFTVRKIALKYDLPFWHIGSSLCIMSNSSAPSPTRFAYQAYAPLCAGAKGLTWFLYYPLSWRESPIDKNGNKTLTWNYMKQINDQALALGKTLLDYRSTEFGVTQLFSEEKYPNLPKLPQCPNNLMVNLKGTYSGRGQYENQDAKFMVGEFESLKDNSRAAMVVNLDVERSVLANFEKPEDAKTILQVSPVDAQARELTDEDVAQGFWLLPGHGALFIFK